MRVNEIQKLSKVSRVWSSNPGLNDWKPKSYCPSLLPDYLCMWKLPWMWAHKLKRLSKSCRKSMWVKSTNCLHDKPLGIFIASTKTFFLNFFSLSRDYIWKKKYSSKYTKGWCLMINGSGYPGWENQQEVGGPWFAGKHIFYLPQYFLKCRALTYNISITWDPVRIAVSDSSLLNQKLPGGASNRFTRPPGDSNAHSGLRTTALPKRNTPFQLLVTRRGI